MSILSVLFGKKENTELVEALQNNAFLVDVRTPAEFSAGSVDGAVNIPLSQVKSQLKKFKGKKNIVVFCRSGARSAQAKQILEQNGIQSVINGRSAKHVEAAKK